METIEKIQSNQQREEKEKKFEYSSELIEIKKILQSLKDKQLMNENPEAYKELSFEAYKKLTGFLMNNGLEFVTDVNYIYRKYGNNFSSPFITRREDPEKVMSLCEGESINLSFDPNVVGDRGDKYANCAIWPYGADAVGGIRNSFLEGRGMAGPIVTMMAVEHNQNNTSLEKPQDSLKKVGTIERDAVRIVSGKIKKEDLKFIILRIQRNFFPQENLTEKEKNSDNKQIFRGFVFE